MTAWLAVKQFVPNHIRPFNPRRDLDDLATLIEVAFGFELVLTNSRVIEDMRQAAYWGGLLRVAQPIMPLFSGYVWIEGGHLVGNATLSQKKPGIWNLSNVAVLPEFRGRGIAGALVDIAVTHARRRGGKRILLQVRSNNQPALALYRRRGFTTFDILHEIDLAPSRWPAIIGSKGAALRGVRALDGRRLYRLVAASTPQATLLRRPLDTRAFRRGVWWQLKQYLQLAFGGEVRFELVGEQEGEIVAYGAVIAHLFRGAHELELHVLPGQRGRWEASLVEGLLRAMRRLPRHRVRAYVSSSHPEALQTLHQLGFETLRVLDQMFLDLA